MSEVPRRVVVARSEYAILAEKAQATTASHLRPLRPRVQLDHDQAWEVDKLGEADWAIWHRETRQSSGTVQTRR